MERDTNSTTERSHWRPRLAMGMIALTAIGYDAVCKKGETISEEVDYLREHAQYGPITTYIINALYKHLMRSVAPEDDIIHGIAQVFGKDDR